MRVDLVGRHHDGLGRPRKWEVLPEDSAASAARISGSREPPPHRKMRPGRRSPSDELFHDQLDAGCPDADVVGDDPGDVIGMLDRDATRVVHLERLGPRKGQVEPIGDALGERAAPEREHPRALDPALAHERHVRRPATDVDEERAGLADLVLTEDPGNGVRLGDDLQELEIELRGDALQGAEMNQRRERVEDPDLDVPTLEPDGIGQRVPVDRRAGHGGVDEPHVDVRADPSPR